MFKKRLIISSLAALILACICGSIVHAKMVGKPIGKVEEKVVYVDGVKTIVNLPASYNPRVPNRYCIYVHGVNGGADDLWKYQLQHSLLTALLKAGYVVIGSDYTARASWGNKQSTIDTKHLVDYYESHYNLESRPYVIMGSMGGIVTLNSIAHGDLHPKAVVGLFPVCNLLNMYEAGPYAKSIADAYGITSLADFKQKTRGYDPVNDDSGKVFASIPFKIWCSYSDTVVNRKQNEDVFQSMVSKAGGHVTIITTTGDHNDKSNYRPPAVVQFFNSH